jgi:hypothetical protein
MRQLPNKVNCNDRKFDTLRLHCVVGKSTEGHSITDSKEFQVYAVPRNDRRGAETSHFKIVVNGIVVTSTDIIELKRKAQEVFTNIAEGDYEKVLVVKTTGDPYGDHLQEKGDRFGLEWQVGWRVSKIDIVFDKTRHSTIDVENYDEPDDPDMYGKFKIGSKVGHRGKQIHKVAVIPWTKEREEMLQKAVVAIGKMRDDFNVALLRPEEFAGILDAKSGLLLGEHKV